MVASSPRRSAVAIAAVLTSDSAANAIDSPMITHTPQAPLWPSVRTVPRYSERVRTCVPGCAAGRLPATNTAASAGTAAWRWASARSMTTWPRPAARS